MPIVSEAAISSACTQRKLVAAPTPTVPVDQERGSFQMATANLGQMTQVQTPTPSRKSDQPRDSTMGGQYASGRRTAGPPRGRLQSAIPEVGDLNTLFQNLVTVPRLERVPSLKEMSRDAGKDEVPYGLLGYPVLQAADILCVKGQVVPVGKDNAAHVEVTREIARHFNHLYGEVFPVPEMIMSETPTLVGTDGQGEMSKSKGNAIALSDDPRVQPGPGEGRRVDGPLPGRPGR